MRHSRRSVVHWRCCVWRESTCVHGRTNGRRTRWLSLGRLMDRLYHPSAVLQRPRNEEGFLKSGINVVGNVSSTGGNLPQMCAGTK